jgi:hypothetical protein
MHTLTLKHARTSTLEPVKRGYRQLPEHLHWFTGEFTFGKSYLLNAEIGKGAWALCWLIGGLLKPDLEAAQILLDGQPYPEKARQRDSWFIRQSEYQGFRASHRTLKSVIQQGLKTHPGPNVPTEAQLIEQFRLTPGRYARKLRQFSHEGWSASGAISMALGRKIICFPYLEFVRPWLIEEYYELWLKAMIDALRDSGALVLVPGLAVGRAQTLCDEIVTLKRPNEYPEP